ncbi:MAG: hypothetical protein JJE44_07820 [Flavobacteriaceae bacterium]|nr:hypothetical protein [Flavobacteriaceae bacterium]
MASRKKTGGRTKGVVNRTTAEIREHYQNLVSDNLEQLKSDLKELEPLARLKIIIELSKFVVPTLKAQDLIISNEESNTQIDYSKLSTETLKELSNLGIKT